MIRFGVILLKAGIAALLVLAWFLPPLRMWQWMVQLWVLECGHWVAALAAITGVLGALLFRFWVRWLSLTLGMIMAMTFCLPSYEARRMDEQFQFNRLWSPKAPATEQLLPLAQIERKTYYRSNGDVLYALIYRPASKPGDAPTHYPWIVSVHSGGWDSGSVDEFAAWNKELVGHGYVILAIDYHLAPHHKWPRQKDDVSRAVTWARENAESLGIDPAKLVLMGRSAGGQIAATCALTLPELEAKGCIAFYAPLDLNFAHDHAEDDDLLHSKLLMHNYLGGDPEQAADNYRSSSAINYISPKMPPMLLMHGTRDALVWVEQSRRFKVRCEKAGIGDRCTFVEPTWATHAFDYFPGSPGSQFAMHSALKFLSEVTK